MIYIGIDPGLDGAIAVVDAKGVVLMCEDTPTLTVKRGKKNKREYQSSVMNRLLRRASQSATGGPANVAVVLEAVNAMPGQGVTSMFSMGMGYGLWHGLIAARRLSLTLVYPQKWKKHYGLNRDKHASITLCQRLIPSSHPYVTLKKHDGRAEAILLANYGRVAAK